MKIISKKNLNNTISIILEYVIVLIMVLGTRSIYAHLTDTHLRLYLILIAVMMIYILKEYFFGKKIGECCEFIRKFTKDYCKYIIIYYAFITIFFVINDIKDRNFITTFFIILPLLEFIYLSSNDNLKKFLTRLTNMIVFLAVISLICYTTVSVLEIFDTTTKVEIDWGGEHKVRSFFNIYFETQTFKLFDSRVPRNTGVFTEAPMYSLVLCMALLIENFILKRKNKFINAILIITIITTFSTTGIIVMSLIYVFKIIEILKNKISISKVQKIGMIILIISLILISSIYFIKRINTSSGSIRFDDYRAAFLAWTESPIIGNGYGNTEVIEKYMSDFRKLNTGLSNSFMVLLAQCGVYLFALYLFAFMYILIDAIRKKKYDIIYLEVIILILFLTTIFTYTPIIINLLAIAYSIIIKDFVKKQNSLIGEKNEIKK